jgi:hypothetical protein
MKTPTMIASQRNYETASGDHFGRLSTSVIPGLDPVSSTGQAPESRLSFWIPASGMTHLIYTNIYASFRLSVVSPEFPPVFLPKEW